MTTKMTTRTLPEILCGQADTEQCAGELLRPEWILRNEDFL
jgi:hypothetical protein